MPNFPTQQPILSFPGQGPAIAVEGMTTLYVNGIAILYSPWDFSFVFLRGLPSEAPQGELPSGEHNFRTTTRPVSSVVMSPQHAKAMLKSLMQNIEAYEKEHGEIPVVESAPSLAQGPSAETPEQPTGGNDA